MKRPGEEGAALLAVLLLVAVMASLSAIALEKTTLAARTAGSTASFPRVWCTMSSSSMFSAATSSLNVRCRV